MDMLVKIKYENNLLEIARVCGCAPCQIIAVNGVRSELELKNGQEISVPVIVEMLVTKTVG